MCVTRAWHRTTSSSGRQNERALQGPDETPPRPWARAAPVQRARPVGSNPKPGSDAAPGCICFVWGYKPHTFFLQSVSKGETRWIQGPGQTRGVEARPLAGTEAASDLQGPGQGPGGSPTWLVHEEREFRFFRVSLNSGWEPSPHFAKGEMVRIKRGKEGPVLGKPSPKHQHLPIVERAGHTPVLKMPGMTTWGEHPGCGEHTHSFGNGSILA